MRYKIMATALSFLILSATTGCPPINVTPHTSTPAVSATIMLTQSNTVVETPTPKENIPDEIRIIVIGVGLAPDTETNQARREQAAIRAAELDAQRNFEKWQEGAQLESVTIVNQGVLETDTIRETLRATVHDIGHTIEKTYDDATGTAQIKVEYTAQALKQ